MAKKLKQAVLLIHGVGEQRPMDTLRGFVDAVWTSDKEVQHDFAIAGVFSKPDKLSGSFELRRLTTTKNKKDVRTDFYEFYWAHLMEGTSIGHVVSWAKSLLLRWPWKVPRQLRGAWALLVIIMLVVLALAVMTALPEGYRVFEIPKWLTGGLGIASAWLVVPIIKNIIGDAARYLHPAPANISRRQNIRAKGVEILVKLHDANEYDRIIVVGHSLGSVIGYDVLTYAWSLFNEKGDKTKPHPVLDEIETAVKDQSLSVSDYQKKQRDLKRELAENGNPWLVTDFLTLGSPLTHAEILLAKDKDQLISKQSDREFPTSPPTLENGKFSYPPDSKQRVLHHAAVFGPTRWTNLYFPARWLIFGDLIGGPLKDLFGWGIADRPVQTKLRKGIFSHTLYWRQGKAANAENHIHTLRESLNLLDN